MSPCIHISWRGPLTSLTRREHICLRTPLRVSGRVHEADTEDIARARVETRLRVGFGVASGSTPLHYITVYSVTRLHVRIYEIHLDNM